LEETSGDQGLLRGVLSYDDDDNILKYRFIYVVTVIIKASTSDIFFTQKIKVKGLVIKKRVKNAKYA